MNNVLNQLLSILMGGGNPMTLLQQIAGNDPRISQFMGMIRGKSSSQMRQMAENMAKERGIDLKTVAQQMGLKLPN